MPESIIFYPPITGYWLLDYEVNMTTPNEQLIAEMAQLTALVGELKAALGAGVPSDAPTGHNRKVEEITGFVKGLRADGQVRIDLYGKPHLEYKIVPMWEEQIDEIGTVFIKPYLDKAKELATGSLKRKEAEAKKFFFPLPKPIYAVVETRDFDDGKGNKTKRSKLISLHDSPVTGDVEQRPVHHHKLDTAVTARQKHQVHGDTLAMCIYPELSDLFNTPASIEETVKLIAGQPISLEAMPEITAVLSLMAWSKYLDADLDRDGLLSIGRQAWQALSAMNNPAPTAAPAMQVVEVQGLPKTAVTAAPSAPINQAGVDELWQSAVEAFEEAGRHKFGLKWAENRSKAIAWAYHNLTSDKELSARDAGKIKLEQVTYSQLVKAANTLNPSPFA